MKKLLPIALCAVLAACGQTRVVDLDNEREVQSMQDVMELEYRDWTKTAEYMTNSMLKCNALTGVSKPVIAQIATNFSGEDTTSNTVRNTRGNDEYDQSTFASKGTLIAPNMSLSGKMIQRNLKLNSGWFSSTDTRVEYYLQLTLTDLKTGLSVWEDEQPIVKEGDHAPTW